MSTLREASRKDYSPTSYPATHTEIQSGAIQRIADATEKMAQNYNQLLNEKRWAEQRADEQRQTAERIARRNRALRGVITKLKRKATA
jgi:hypothetical protein